MVPLHLKKEQIILLPLELQLELQPEKKSGMDEKRTPTSHKVGIAVSGHLQLDHFSCFGIGMAILVLTILAYWILWHLLF